MEMPTKFYALRRDRRALTDALDACPRGAFPGSAGSKRESAAIKALAEFDAAHPEVIAYMQHLDAKKAAEQTGETNLEGQQ